jgi:hypothetical protein
MTYQFERVGMIVYRSTGLVKSQRLSRAWFEHAQVDGDSQMLRGRLTRLVCRQYYPGDRIADADTMREGEYPVSVIDILNSWPGFCSVVVEADCVSHGIWVLQLSE